MTPEELAELHAQCFPNKPMSTDRARRMLAMPRICVLGGKDAFLMASVVPPEADITDMGVHPRARRTGQARRLIATLQAKVDKIFLEVAVSNTAAVALYQSTGFAITGRRPRYYEEEDGWVDALVMTWAAAGAGDAISVESVDPPAR